MNNVVTKTSLEVKLARQPRIVSCNSCTMGNVTIRKQCQRLDKHFYVTKRRALFL